MALTYPKCVKLTNLQIEEYEKIIKEYNFESWSEFLKVGISFLVKFLEYKIKCQDNPEKLKEIAELYDPLIQHERDYDGMKNIIGDYTERQLETFYYMMGLERTSRKETKVKRTRINEIIRRHHGVFEPKVGYILTNEEDIEYYRPMREYDKGYDELSDNDKQVLQLEVEEKQRVLDEEAKKKEEESQRDWDKMNEMMNNNQ